MKICISDSKRYLLLYFLFCVLFSVAVIVLIGLAAHWRATVNTDAAPPSEISEKDPLPVVIIDAGHGGEDGGAIGANGAYEKDLNLKIAFLLNDLLCANGIETVMTRTEDVLLYDRNSDYRGQKKVQDLATRRRIAEAYDSAVFVSIHMNAFPQSQYHGLQVYYSPNDATSAELAKKIQACTKELLLPQNNRVVKPSGGGIYLLDRLQCPAVLVECGFLSNPEECARLSEEEYQQQLALAIGISVLQYLSDFPVNSQSAS